MPLSFEPVSTRQIKQVAEAIIPEVLDKAEDQDLILKSVNALPAEMPRLTEQEMLIAMNSDISKALVSSKTQETGDPKSYTFNPLTIYQDAISHKVMVSGVSYRTLEEMAKQCAPVAAIINTRINQLTAFARPQRTKHSLGFRVQKKYAKKMNESQKKKAREYEEFIINCGRGSAANKRDYFEMFLKKIGRDRLTYDQVNFERVFTYGGRLHEILAVDASTIRLAIGQTSQYTNNSLTSWDKADRSRGPGDKLLGTEMAYLQVLNGQKMVEYTSDEMAFLINWPRTNVDVAGYGYSEIEMLISTITAILFSAEYNRRFFSSGSSPKGVLNVKGNMNQSQLDAFKKNWLNQLSGITGAWRTPIVAAEGGLEFVNMQQTNREMEFSKYNDFLIKLTCAVFQASPEEINFASQMTDSGSGAVFNSKPEMRLQASRDKGLVPLLAFFENGMNRGVMSYIDPDYEIELVGLDGGTEGDQVELHEKELKTFKTVNEVREQNDLPPVEGGDEILNPVFAQLKIAKMTQEAQKETLKMTQEFQEEQTKEGQEFQEEQGDKQMEQDAEQQREQMKIDTQLKREQMEMDHQLDKEMAAKEAKEGPKKPGDKKPAPKKAVKKGLDDEGNWENEDLDALTSLVQRGVVMGEFEKIMKSLEGIDTEVIVKEPPIA